MSSTDPKTALAVLGKMFRQLGPACDSVTCVPSKKTATWSVDSRWRLYYNPTVNFGWSDAFAVGVAAHEIIHLLSGHANRRGERDLPKWRRSIDREANQVVKDLGLETETPPFIITTEAGAPVGMISWPGYLPLRPNLKDVPAELHYLHEPDVKTCDPNDPDHCDPGPEGTGADGTPLHDELPDGSPNAPGLPQHAIDRIKDDVAQAILNDSARGDMPAGLLRIAQNVRRPKLKWPSHLKAALRELASPDSDDYDWSRRDRRTPIKLWQPAIRRSFLPRIAVIGDTSGSMGDSDLGLAIGTVASILSHMRAELYWIACDAAATAPLRVRTSAAAAAHLLGGGGTDMCVGIASAYTVKPSVIVVVTDCETPWPTAPTTVPLLVVATPQAHIASIPTWARKISMKE